MVTGPSSLLESNDDAPRWRRTPEHRPSQILDAALALFADVGYEDTSVQGIAMAAGVSVGTIYRYFPSKEHVLDGLHHRFHGGLEGVFEGVADQLRARVTVGESLGAATAADALVDGVAVYLRSQASACRVIATHVPRVHDLAERERHDQRFVDRLAALLDAGVELGMVASTDPAMTARLLYYGMRDSFTIALAADDPFTLDRLAEQAKEVITKTLALPSG